MKLKKIVVSIAALSVLALAIVLGTDRVRADEENIYPPIIQKLADRFNLDAEEIRQVFDEEKEERQQRMWTRLEERLNQAVSEGKISQEQKEAIISKADEMKANCEEPKDLALQEKRKNREAHKQEMEAWAKENGIDFRFVSMLLGARHCGGLGRPRFNR